MVNGWVARVTRPTEVICFHHDSDTETQPQRPLLDTLKKRLGLFSQLPSRNFPRDLLFSSLLPPPSRLAASSSPRLLCSLSMLILSESITMVWRQSAEMAPTEPWELELCGCVCFELRLKNRRAFEGDNDRFLFLTSVSVTSGVSDLDVLKVLLDRRTTGVLSDLFSTLCGFSRFSVALGESGLTFKMLLSDREDLRELVLRPDSIVGEDFLSNISVHLCTIPSIDLFRSPNVLAGDARDPGVRDPVGVAPPDGEL